MHLKDKKLTIIIIILIQKLTSNKALKPNRNNFIKKQYSTTYNRLKRIIRGN